MYAAVGLKGLTSDVQRLYLDAGCREQCGCKAGHVGNGAVRERAALVAGEDASKGHDSSPLARTTTERMSRSRQTVASLYTRTWPSHNVTDTLLISPTK